VAVSARAGSGDGAGDRLAARQGRSAARASSTACSTSAASSPTSTTGRRARRARLELPRAAAVLQALEAYEGGASEWHGASGELGVSDLRNDHPYCEAWLAAGAEAGYPLTDDFNGARCDGLGRYQLTLRGHWRCDAATAFPRTRCAAAEPRRATGAHVTRVVVEAGRATGVEWDREGGEQGRARAEREVIVAAGRAAVAAAAAALGHRPRRLLRRHGIASSSTRRSRPQPAGPLPGARHRQAEGERSLNDDSRNPAAWRRWARNGCSAGAGPLTVGAGQVGRPRRQRAREGGRADVLSTSCRCRSTSRRSRCTASRASRPRRRNAGRLDGTVEIAGADPLAPPRIRAGYLTEPRDAQVLVAGLRILREIYAQPAFPTGLVTGEEYLPGNDVTSAAGLEPLRAPRAARCSTRRAPAAWAATRARWSTSACACAASRLARDRRLGHAARRLTNTNAAAIMIGEKGAAMVLEDAGGSASASSRRREAAPA
jgi:choline dehydrogenase